MTPRWGRIDLLTRWHIPLALHHLPFRALIVFVVLSNTLAIGRGYLAIPLCRGPYELC